MPDTTVSKIRLSVATLDATNILQPKRALATQQIIGLPAISISVLPADG